MPDMRQIIPFEGVDDIRFGMTPEQVADTAGPPDDVRRQRVRRRLRERRGATEFDFDDDTGALQSVVVYRPGRGKAAREQFGDAPYVPALYDGIEILDPVGFETLVQRERTREGIGGIGVLFPDVGFLVAGFRKRIPEGRYVTAFSRERLPFYEAWLDV